VATFLDMPSIRVHEVATFYTMFHLKPVGTYHIKFCGTTPCMLCGCEDVMNISLEHLSLSLGEVSKDGLFSTEEVECLGACANGPVVMINDDFYEDLNAERLIHIIEQLKKGHTPKKGSSIGRHASEPFTLKEQEDDSSSINHKGEKS
jgi:NADH:ubiquinone oxidoreductase subunit E